MSAAVSRRGFILQPTYRIHGGRPVVYLYGTLEGGGSFLLRDRRVVPRFYVRAADGEAAAAIAAEMGATVPGATDPGAMNKMTLAGEPAMAIEVAKPHDTPPLRDRLQAAGIAPFEADVRFAMRYLIDRRIKGALAIRGEAKERAGVGLVFDDPEAVEPADWTPRLSVLSFDIETDMRHRRLLSIALYGCGAAEVLMLNPEGYDPPGNAIACASEAELLDRFCARVQELDPDVLTGWNVAGFDLATLDRLASHLRRPLPLGRGPGRLRLRRPRGGRGGVVATVPGRLVLDGVDLLQGAFVRMESYALDAVAREVLGEGKLIAGSGRGEEIMRLFEEDRQLLAEYNLTDARLVIDILDELQLIELAVERSLLTGMPPDRVAASIASFDFLYLSELGARGVVAPTVGRASGEGTGGGAVLPPHPGLYDNVLVCDFKSLYPSLIRTFNIDPLGFLPGVGGPMAGSAGTGEQAAASDDGGPIVAPNGAAFSRRPGILPRLLDDLMPRRDAAKRAGRKVESHAIKILMNSFYGVLGTPACRFYNPKIANAITAFGRQLLGWCRDRVEGYGHRVLYGDTDSLFIASGEDDPAAARRVGERLVERLNADLEAHVAANWAVDSRLEIELERLYLRLLLPEGRGGGGASKRYAGLIEGGSGGEGGGEREVVFTGLEAVRRDWTDLARQVQRELYRRLFHDLPVEEYLERTVAALRAGELDELLVYRKRLRKPLAEYTSTTPPHVAAARKMSRPPRRTIAYVMTAAGPEPTAERRNRLDYEHYVDKQIRPVSEPVLAQLGIEFARAIGDDTQMALF